MTLLCTVLEWLIILSQVYFCDVEFPIRLEGLVLTHSEFSRYEPELFPALIYRMVRPRTVLLIFSSGKVGSEFRLDSKFTLSEIIGAWASLGLAHVNKRNMMKKFQIAINMLSILLPHATRDLQPNTGYLIPATQYVLPDTWCIYHSVTWYLFPGTCIWYLACVTRYILPKTYYLVLATRYFFLTIDTWYLIWDAFYMMLTTNNTSKCLGF